jgi:protein FAM50
MASYTGGMREASRIQALEGERAARKKELDRQRGDIASASASAGVLGARKFAAHSDSVEELLKSDTVGLVTHEDFKARREYLEKCAAEEREKRKAKQRIEDAETRKQKLGKANISKLSFANSGDSDESSNSENDRRTISNPPDLKVSQSARDTDDGPRLNAAEKDLTLNLVHGVPDTERSAIAAEPATGQFPSKRPRMTKNPDANIDFLPDRDRELAEEAERERLKQEWFNDQERRKAELVNVTYSYWDGSGHRRALRCKKGTTIGRFLGMVVTQFKELRNVGADDLMFIKEDLIIPHHYSFYDFIVSKARGKSGPLFNFEVVEDVRLVSDAKKEKEDAHAAKVVERRWYERNRHIFPASRWVTFDPKKKVSMMTTCPVRYSGQLSDPSSQHISLSKRPGSLTWFFVSFLLCSLMAVRSLYNSRRLMRWYRTTKIRAKPCLARVAVIYCFFAGHREEIIA